VTLGRHETCCIAAGVLILTPSTVLRHRDVAREFSCSRFNSNSGVSLSMSGFRAQSACMPLMLLPCAVLAGCDDRMSPPPPRTHRAGRQASSPSGRRPAPWCANCRGGSRRRGCRMCDRALSGIVVQRLFNQGARSRRRCPSTRSIRGRSRSGAVDEAALARAKATLEQATQHANRIATLTSQRAAPEPKTRSDCEPASGRGRSRRPQGRRRARQTQSRLRTIRAPIDGSSVRPWSAKARWWCRRDRESATIQQLDPIYADSRNR